MDSLDKLSLLITVRGCQKEIPIIIPPLLTKNPLFYVYEFEDAVLTNESQNFDCFIENLDLGGENKLAFGESFPINNSNRPNPVMDYRLRLVEKKTGRSTNYLYKIKHTTLTNEDQYRTMIKTIAEYDENLLYDQDGKFLSSRHIVNASHRSLLVLCRQLTLNKTCILTSLNSIYNNPITKEEKEVVKTSTFGKQSFHSIIKNVKRSGLSAVYSYKRTTKSDIPLNRYLVFMLSHSKEVLHSLEEEAVKALNNAIKTVELIESRCNKDFQKRKKNTLSQIEQLNARIAIFNDFLRSSKEITRYINRLLTSNFFASISPSSIRDASVIYNDNYRIIENRLFFPLYEESIFSFAKFYGAFLTSPFKQTSFLFESYCLLSIDSAITSLGFERIDGEIDYNHIVKRFIMGEFEFDLYYSINAKDVSDVKEGEFYTIQKNTRHVTPDFFLLLKKSDTPVCLLVLEAKCRKICDVERDIVEGVYETSIRDYLSIRYSSNENPFTKPKIVDSLWLLVPKENGNVDCEKNSQLEYRFIRLAIDGDEQEFIETFKEFMMPFLNDE